MNDDAIGRAQISYHSIVQLRPLPFSLYFNKFYYCKLNRKCISHARGYHPSPFGCVVWFLNSPICEWLLISYCGISGGHNAERRLSPTNDERNNYSPTAPWGWGRSPKERRLLHRAIAAAWSLCHYHAVTRTACNTTHHVDPATPRWSATAIPSIAFRAASISATPPSGRYSVLHHLQAGTPCY